MSLLKNKALRYLIPILLIAGTFLLLHNQLQNIENSPVMTRSPWALSTDKVVIAKTDSGFPALGKVVSSTEVRIGSQISGTVLSMGPREGGSVSMGDLLVRVDTRQFEADADAVKANLASALAVEANDRKELGREQKLFEHGDLSASAVEKFQTRVRTDEATVRALKKQLDSLQVKISYGRILSPITGRISKRLAEIGDTVFPGKSIYYVTAEQGGRVIVPIPLDTVNQIKVNSRVQLSSGNQQMTALVTRINPSLDSLAMGSLEIDLPQRPFNLPNGAPISARVITAEAGPGLTVDKNALRPSDNSNYRSLFKVNLTTTSAPAIQLITVSVELCGSERCMINGDLQPGDEVVVAHSSVLLQLHDGDPIMAEALESNENMAKPKTNSKPDVRKD